MSTEQTSDQSPSGQELMALGGSRPLFPEEIRTRVAAGRGWSGSSSAFPSSCSRFAGNRQSFSPSPGRALLTRPGIQPPSLSSWVRGGSRGGSFTRRGSVWVNLTGGVDETDVLYWPSERTERPPSGRGGQADSRVRHLQVGSNRRAVRGG